MIDLQDSAHLTSMTSVAADIDLSVEKIIRRCLEPDPAKRPAGALAVAAALPGGDPLAAALAAGETPSPEIVAAAGDTEGLARKYSVPCLLLVIVCLMGTVAYRQAATALMRVPADSPPEVMAHKSREMVSLLGYPKHPADSAVWLESRGELVEYLNGLPAPRKMEEWLAAESPVRSVYRESPYPLYAHPAGEVSVDNPPPVTPGMVNVILDGNGKLLLFSALPYNVGDDFTPPVQKETVFRAAGLDMAAFTETAPTLLPPGASDQVRAWKGPHPKIPKTELTVEIASWKGRITRAQLIYPYSRTGGGQAPSLPGRLRDYAFQFLPVVAAFFVALMARGNWKQKRADRQGALRVAMARFVLGLIAWSGFMHPVANQGMQSLFLASVGNWLLSAAITWVMYLALEPAVRARWPHAMVTWNRALAGRWLDAQVNGHILIGAALGSLLWLTFKILTFFLELPKGGATTDVSLYFILGSRQWFGGHAGILENALRIGLTIFLAIFALRQMLRHELLAALAASILFTMTETAVTRSADWLFMGVIFVILYMVMIFVLLRLGLVAMIAAAFFINASNALVLGADWKAWYAPSGLATLLLLLGIALFAFWRSLGSRELLSNEDPAS